MSTASPTAQTPWARLGVDEVADVLRASQARWWLSGGAALDHWLGDLIRPRINTDVSTTSGDVGCLLADLPTPYSAWVDDDGAWIPWEDAPKDLAPYAVNIYDGLEGVWVLRVNVEDGSDRAWVYRRDPRLQLPWDEAVLNVGGVPTGAPQIQLVWKAFSPRAEDDTDKDAVLPRLSAEARGWWERAILTIHPHSSWAIHVRSPMFPGKSSWNRGKS